MTLVGSVRQGTKNMKPKVKCHKSSEEDDNIVVGDTICCCLKIRHWLLLVLLVICFLLPAILSQILTLGNFWSSKMPLKLDSAKYEADDVIFPKLQLQQLKEEELEINKTNESSLNNNINDTASGYGNNTPSVQDEENEEKDTRKPLGHSFFETIKDIQRFLEPEKSSVTDQADLKSLNDATIDFTDSNYIDFKESEPNLTGVPTIHDIINYSSNALKKLNTLQKLEYQKIVKRDVRFRLLRRSPTLRTEIAKLAAIFLSKIEQLTSKALEYENFTHIENDTHFDDLEENGTNIEYEKELNSSSPSKIVTILKHAQQIVQRSQNSHQPNGGVAATITKSRSDKMSNDSQKQTAVEINASFTADRKLDSINSNKNLSFKSQRSNSGNEHTLKLQKNEKLNDSAKTESNQFKEVQGNMKGNENIDKLKSSVHIELTDKKVKPVPNLQTSKINSTQNPTTFQPGITTNNAQTLLDRKYKVITSKPSTVQINFNHSMDYKKNTSRNNSETSEFKVNNIKTNITKLQNISKQVISNGRNKNFNRNSTHSNPNVNMDLNGMITTSVNNKHVFRTKLPRQNVKYSSLNVTELRNGSTDIIPNTKINTNFTHNSTYSRSNVDVNLDELPTTIFNSNSTFPTKLPQQNVEKDYITQDIIELKNSSKDAAPSNKKKNFSRNSSIRISKPNVNINLNNISTILSNGKPMFSTKLPQQNTGKNSRQKDNKITNIQTNDTNNFKSEKNYVKFDMTPGNQDKVEYSISSGITYNKSKENTKNSFVIYEAPTYPSSSENFTNSSRSENSTNSSSSENSTNSSSSENSTNSSSSENSTNSLNSENSPTSSDNEIFANSSSSENSTNSSYNENSTNSSYNENSSNILNSKNSTNSLNDKGLPNLEVIIKNVPFKKEKNINNLEIDPKRHNDVVQSQNNVSHPVHEWHQEFKHNLNDHNISGEHFVTLENSHLQENRSDKFQLSVNPSNQSQYQNEKIPASMNNNKQQMNSSTDFLIEVNNTSYFTNPNSNIRNYQLINRNKTNEKLNIDKIITKSKNMDDLNDDEHLNIGSPRYAPLNILHEIEAESENASVKLIEINTYEPTTSFKDIILDKVVSEKISSKKQDFNEKEDSITLLITNDMIDSKVPDFTYDSTPLLNTDKSAAKIDNFEPLLVSENLSHERLNSEKKIFLSTPENQTIENINDNQHFNETEYLVTLQTITETIDSKFSKFTFDSTTLPNILTTKIDDTIPRTFTKNINYTTLKMIMSTIPENQTIHLENINEHHIQHAHTESIENHNCIHHQMSQNESVEVLRRFIQNISLHLAEILTYNGQDTRLLTDPEMQHKVSILLNSHHNKSTKTFPRINDTSCNNKSDLEIQSQETGNHKIIGDRIQFSNDASTRILTAEFSVLHELENVKLKADDGSRNQQSLPQDEHLSSSNRLNAKNHDSEATELKAKLSENSNVNPREFSPSTVHAEINIKTENYNTSKERDVENEAVKILELLTSRYNYSLNSLKNRQLHKELLKLLRDEHNSPESKQVRNEVVINNEQKQTSHEINKNPQNYSEFNNFKLKYQENKNLNEEKSLISSDAVELFKNNDSEKVSYYNPDISFQSSNLSSYEFDHHESTANDVQSLSQLLQSEIANYMEHMQNNTPHENVSIVNEFFTTDNSETTADQNQESLDMNLSELDELLHSSVEKYVKMGHNMSSDNMTEIGNILKDSIKSAFKFAQNEHISISSLINNNSEERKDNGNRTAKANVVRRRVKNNTPLSNFLYSLSNHKQNLNNFIAKHSNENHAEPSVIKPTVLQNNVASKSNFKDPQILLKFEADSYERSRHISAEVIDKEPNIQLNKNLSPTNIKPIDENENSLNFSHSQMHPYEHINPIYRVTNQNSNGDRNDDDSASSTIVVQKLIPFGKETNLQNQQDTDLQEDTTNFQSEDNNYFVLNNPNEKFENVEQFDHASESFLAISQNDLQESELINSKTASDFFNNDDLKNEPNIQLINEEQPNSQLEDLSLKNEKILSSENRNKVRNFPEFSNHNLVYKHLDHYHNIVNKNNHNNGSNENFSHSAEMISKEVMPDKINEMKIMKIYVEEHSHPFQNQDISPSSYEQYENIEQNNHAGQTPIPSYTLENVDSKKNIKNFQSTIINDKSEPDSTYISAPMNDDKIQISVNEDLSLKNEKIGSLHTINTTVCNSSSDETYEYLDQHYDEIFKNLVNHTHSTNVEGPLTKLAEIKDFQSTTADDENEYENAHISELTNSDKLQKLVNENLPIKNEKMENLHSIEATINGDLSNETYDYLDPYYDVIFENLHGHQHSTYSEAPLVKFTTLGMEDNEEDNQKIVSNEERVKSLQISNNVRHLTPEQNNDNISNISTDVEKIINASQNNDHQRSQQEVSVNDNYWKPDIDLLVKNEKSVNAQSNRGMDNNEYHQIVNDNSQDLKNFDKTYYEIKHSPGINDNENFQIKDNVNLFTTDEEIINIQNKNTVTNSYGDISNDEMYDFLNKYYRNVDPEIDHLVRDSTAELKGKNDDKVLFSHSQNHHQNLNKSNYIVMPDSVTNSEVVLAKRESLEIDDNMKSENNNSDYNTNQNRNNGLVYTQNYGDSSTKFIHVAHDNDIKYHSTNFQEPAIFYNEKNEQIIKSVNNEEPLPSHENLLIVNKYLTDPVDEKANSPVPDNQSIIPESFDQEYQIVKQRNDTTANNIRSKNNNGVQNINDFEHPHDHNSEINNHEYEKIEEKRKNAMSSILKLLLDSKLTFDPEDNGKNFQKTASAQKHADSHLISGNIYHNMQLQNEEMNTAHKINNAAWNDDVTIENSNEQIFNFEDHIPLTNNQNQNHGHENRIPVVEYDNNFKIQPNTNLFANYDEVMKYDIERKTVNYGDNDDTMNFQRDINIMNSQSGEDTLNVHSDEDLQTHGDTNNFQNNEDTINSQNNEDLVLFPSNEKIIEHHDTKNAVNNQNSKDNFQINKASVSIMPNKQSEFQLKENNKVVNKNDSNFENNRYNIEEPVNIEKHQNSNEIQSESHLSLNEQNYKWRNTHIQAPLEYYENEQPVVLVQDVENSNQNFKNGKTYTGLSSNLQLNNDQIYNPEIDNNANLYNQPLFSNNIHSRHNQFQITSVPVSNDQFSLNTKEKGKKIENPINFQNNHHHVPTYFAVRRNPKMKFFRKNLRRRFFNTN